jgi:hypothetical protein
MHLKAILAVAPSYCRARPNAERARSRQGGTNRARRYGSGLCRVALLPFCFGQVLLNVIINELVVATDTTFLLRKVHALEAA